MQLFVLLIVLWAAEAHPGSPPKPFQGPIDIILLPHSHQDAGFIVTYSHVRDNLCDRTYQTIFECLDADPSRSFNVAEINFFSHWFDAQNSTTQGRVRQMVASGQYGFNEGGWVQPDEGCTSYQGRINQATLGQEWLADRLGVYPTSGWHMDPFGNSGVSPRLFEGYGFDSHVTCAGRLPAIRLGGSENGQTRWHWHQQLQNVWAAGGATIFQHIIEGMYMELSGDPDWPGHGYLWESGLPAIVAEGQGSMEALYHHHQRKFSSAPRFDVSPPVNSSNVQRLSEDLVRRARNNTQYYAHTGNATGGAARPTIMLPWGGDWTFSQSAHIMFNNMDKIILWINSHSTDVNATIKYGTLDQYLDIVHHGSPAADPIARATPSALQFSVVEGDFFPNDDECCQAGLVKKVHSCWSGYFSSFPGLKFALRQLDSTLRHAEILSLLATPQANMSSVLEWEGALGWGRHTQAIPQHHDAITGTGGDQCDAQYHLMLRNASELARQVIANTTSALTGAPRGLTAVHTPPIPPATLDPDPLSPTGPKCARVKTYEDCHPNPGGEAQCHRMGCCWVPAPSHPYCFRPAAAASLNASSLFEGDWPEDGTVLQLPNSGTPVRIIASNPLAWDRTEIVTLRVRSSSADMVLMDGKGAVVIDAQLAPPAPWNASLDASDPGSHIPRHEAWAQWATGHRLDLPQLSRLVFRVTIPALGSVTHFLQAAQSRAITNVNISKVVIGDGTRGFTMRNSRVLVDVSSSGLLDRVHINDPVQRGNGSSELQLGQDLMLYWGNGGRDAPSSNWDGTGGDGGSQSDAYVFSPQGPASSLARFGPEDDPGFWPTAGKYAPKPPQKSATVTIEGPVLHETSSIFAVGTTKAWQAVRVYQASGVDLVERALELAYLIEPLDSNQDLVARFNTGLITGAILQADEAGWTQRAQPPKLDFDSMQSKIGCNFHGTSGWAAISSTQADGSLSMLTDRARAAASLADGSLEYVLHRHATGGNGRGPSDGDQNGARGVVTILPSADRATFIEAQQLQPQMVLRRANPVALLIPTASSDDTASDSGPGPASADWSPLLSPLPPSVHLLGLARRAFQSGIKSGNIPSYPSGKPQGSVRLQHIGQPGPEQQCVTVDLTKLLVPSLGIDFVKGKLEERTLSLARTPDQVMRRSWSGVASTRRIRTPSKWREVGHNVTNSPRVELSPLEIRSYVFGLD